MFCRACGIEFPAHAKFCRSCGKPLEISIPGPQYNVGNSIQSSPGVSPPSRSVAKLGGVLAAAAAIGTVLFVVLTHQPQGDDDARSVVPSTVRTVDDSVSNPLLNVRAGDCALGAGKSVSIPFAPTNIPAGLSVDRTQLCAIASESAHRNEAEIRKQLEGLCQAYLPLMRRAGIDDYAVAAQTLQNSENASDNATQQAILVLKECANKDLAVRTALSGLGIRIYSVGSVRTPRGSCLAYLEEMTGMQGAGGSTSYFLHGTGECSNENFHKSDLVFHPESNPSGRPPGDVIHDLYAYTGPLPSEWIYKGVKYPFGGTGSVAISATKETDSAKVGPERSASSTSPPQTSATTMAWREASLDALQKAAGDGDADAQTELALRFQQGNSVAKDYQQAAMWYRKAADLGSPRAATNLGWMYVLAEGVERNDKEAITLFQAAAVKGYPNAQDSLGWMYQHGRGVPKDIPTAMDWYRKAAAQGFEKSKQNLALLESKQG